jgi:hypothetical protein
VYIVSNLNLRGHQRITPSNTSILRPELEYRDLPITGTTRYRWTDPNLYYIHFSQIKLKYLMKTQTHRQEGDLTSLLLVFQNKESRLDKLKQKRYMESYGIKIYVMEFKKHVNSSTFWDMTQGSPVKLNQRFGVTYPLHLQGRRVSHTRIQDGADSVWKFACCLLHAGPCSSETSVDFHRITRR